MRLFIGLVLCLSTALGCGSEAEVAVDPVASVQQGITAIRGSCEVGFLGLALTGRCVGYNSGSSEIPDQVGSIVLIGSCPAGAPYSGSATLMSVKNCDNGCATTSVLIDGPYGGAYTCGVKKQCG